MLQALEGQPYVVLCCAVFAGGRRLASFSVDRTIRVWDLSTGQCSQILEGHTGAALCCVCCAGAAGAGIPLIFLGRGSKEQENCSFPRQRNHHDEVKKLPDGEEANEQYQRRAIVFVFLGGGATPCTCGDLYEDIHPESDPLEDGKTPWACFSFSQWQVNVYLAQARGHQDVTVYKKDLFGNGDGHGHLQLGEAAHMHEQCGNFTTDSFRGSSVKFGKIQRRLAWPLRMDDTHYSTSVNVFFTAVDMDTLRGSSVEIAKMQRRLKWPLRKDGTHKSRSVHVLFNHGRPGYPSGIIR